MAYSPRTHTTGVQPNVALRQAGAVDEGLRAHMKSVFNWMAAGLATSGLAAYLVATQPGLREMFFQTVAKDGGGTGLEMTWLAIGVLLAPFGLILAMGARMHSMSPASAQKMLLALCACMGVSLAPVVMTYTSASLAQTFFVAAGTFAATSLYGYTTNADLTRFGNLVLMALIGLIIAGVVNVLLASPAFDFVYSAVGVLVFVGITAYDAQRIKVEYLERAGSAGAEMEAKFAVSDALSMYLNFVNLFLYLLRFMGVKAGED